MTNHIALFESQTPVNTGDIAWICAVTNTPLRLIEPLGFSTDDKHLKRAGLGYWNDINVTYYKDLVAFLAYMAGKHLHLVTRFAHQTYSEINYNGDEDHYFPFGKETTDLPETFMRENEEKCIRISVSDEHMHSLDLSNTVALIIYEVLR